jgi:DNA topoisomerase-1
VHDKETLKRIKALAIPPAWTDVWVCPNPRGHVQATGHDERGRKQYLYHDRWREVRDETKYARMTAFGRALPRIRERVAHDLSLPGLPREKVLATVVSLLEMTLIRVGNEQYARSNRSFGLTTMRNRHVEVDGSQLRFKFKGKSGKTHSIGIKDRRLAAIVKRCQELPGQELFAYIDDDGVRRAIDSSDVNEYLKEIGGDDFTSKDFRTWAGTVLAAQTLREMAPVKPRSKTQARRNVTEAVQYVSERLGNTPAICRKSYINPMVIESYLDGSLLKKLKVKAGKEQPDKPADLSSEEEALLEFLQR